MQQDPWFWIALVAYVGGGVNLLIWVTDGGDAHTRVKRWRLFAVAVFWPLCTAYGLLNAFYEWFFQPPALPEDDA